MRGSERAARVVAIGLAVVGLGLLVDLSLATIDTERMWLGGRVFHFVGYTVLTAVGSFAVAGFRHRHRARALWLGLGLAALGVGAEIVQASMATRDADIYDALANVAGIIVGWGLWLGLGAIVRRSVRGRS